MLKYCQQLLRVVEDAQVVSGHSIATGCQALFDMLEPKKKLGEEGAQWVVGK